MEWRCEWCGKPHDEDDPPCDNCGHGSFEKAVVRQTDLSEDGPETTTVWVCTECGREHPKNAPPCSRCGNATLDRQQSSVDETELSAPGYTDLLSPLYVAALAVVVVLGTVLALGATGVVDVPGFPDDGVPDVQNVPGNETRAGDVSLSAVEDAYLAEVNEQRETDAVARLERTSGLDEVATFYNQRAVKEVERNGTLPSEDRLASLLGGECNSRATSGFGSIRQNGSTDPAVLGTRFVQQLQGAQINPSQNASKIGVDIHSVDGRLYLSYILCL